MTPGHINDIATLVVLAAAAPALGYTLTYGLGSPWWRSPLGVIMFLLGVSLCVVFSVVLARRLMGEYTGYEWVAIFAYSLVNVALWSLWAIVIIERRRASPVLTFPPLRKRHGMAENLTTVGVDDEGQRVTVSTETGDPTRQLNPKVAATALAGGALVIVIAVLSAVTPDMLDGLGQWAPLATAAIVAAVGVLAGYVKRP